MTKSSVLLVGENIWLLRALCSLIESDQGFTVAGSCSFSEAEAMCQEIMPDMVLFLPGISFGSYQASFVRVREILPHSKLIMISPVDPALYAALIDTTPLNGFISPRSLGTDLFISLRALTERQSNTDALDEKRS